MNNGKLTRLIQGAGTFLIGIAFSSALSYDFGLGDWLRKTEPLFMAVVVILLGILFYLSKTKRVSQRTSSWESTLRGLLQVTECGLRASDSAGL